VLPLGNAWREYQAAVTAINAKDVDDKDLEATFPQAQDRIVYTEDATLQGIYLKLRLLAETEASAAILTRATYRVRFRSWQQGQQRYRFPEAQALKSSTLDPADRRLPGLDRRVHRAIQTKRGPIQVVIGCL
jgi:hypothetical protein